MKKTVLSALLLAAGAVSASAENFLGRDGKNYSGPNEGYFYDCTYENYSGSAVDSSDGGYSYWIFDVYYGTDGKPMLRGIEYFLATDRYGNTFRENYKSTWAAPANKPDYSTGTTYTQWEYTFNPYGPQCKQANVFFGGFKLTFGGCSDGHSRTCWLRQ